MCGPRGMELSSGHHMGMDAETALDDLRAAAFAGFDALDCGDIYSGVEELIGVFRGGSFAPPEWVAPVPGGSARVHTKFVPDRRLLGGLTFEHVRAVIRRSQNRLATAGPLDLVQFHWWDYAVGSFLDAAGHLKHLKEAGHIRHLGLTNFSCAATRQILDSGVPLAVTQVQYSLLDRRPETDGLVTLCVERGVAIVSYGAIAGGFLSDKWLDADPPNLSAAQENRSLTKYALIVQEFGGWPLLQELLRCLRAVADAHEPPSTISEVAVAWVLSRPGVGAVIVGARNSRHLASTRSASALRLNAEELEQIAAVLAKADGPRGEVYGLERSPVHGAVMRYNLNHAGTSLHLTEFTRRCLRAFFMAEHCWPRFAEPEVAALGMLPREGAALGRGKTAGGGDGQHDSETPRRVVESVGRLTTELEDIGHPLVLCADDAPLDAAEAFGAHSGVLWRLLRLHLSLRAGVGPLAEHLAQVASGERTLGHEAAQAMWEAVCTCLRAIEGMPGENQEAAMERARVVFSSTATSPDNDHHVLCAVAFRTVVSQLPAQTCQ